MKFWLDDIRPAPPGWVHARNYDEAIAIIGERGHEITEASLDHDLGEEHYKADYSDARTGYNVLEFMLENGLRPEIHLHTMNPVGLERMLALLEHYEVE